MFYSDLCLESIWTIQKYPADLKEDEVIRSRDEGLFGTELSEREDRQSDRDPLTGLNP